MEQEQKPACKCGCNCATQPATKAAEPQPAATPPNRHFLQAIGSTAVGVLYAIFPKCPMCWAAWMSLFGSVGLTQVPYQPWLAPVLAALLLLHLGLLYRAIPQKGAAAFALSIGGVALLLAARYWTLEDGFAYAGLALVVTGSVLHGLPPSALMALKNVFNPIFSPISMQFMKQTKKYFIYPLLLSVLTVGYLQAQNFTQPLPIPPLYEGILNAPKDRIYTLEPEEGMHQFQTGQQFYETAGYNGMGYLGPTIVWNTGDSVTMEVHNHLHHTTTVHWHGAHVPAIADGGPHDSIPHDSLWLPRFKILNPASTLWYHPHLHHHTLEQVNLGLAGLLIVRDPNDPFEAQLPHTYNVDEFPIVVQDKDLTADTINTSCTMGTTFLVNGIHNPILEVPAQMVRFRILNASSERVFALYLNDAANQVADNFHIIATDAGYTEKPLATNFTVLSSGERIEWVMDFTGREGQEIYLANMPSFLDPSMPGNPTSAVPSCYNGGNQNYVDSFSVNMLKIKIVAPTANPIATFPAAFAPLDKPDINQVTVERTKRLEFYAENTNFGAPPFIIDSLNFDIGVINDIVRLNDTEIWKIRNTSGVAHPFHIHDISFFILDVRDLVSNSLVTPLPLYFMGPKDVVLVPDNTEIRFITKFTDFYSPIEPFYGYMYHCHILAHEDGGMMHQFVVTDIGVNGTDQAPATPDDWGVFPNPSQDALHLSGLCAEESKVYLYNLLGQRIAQYLVPPVEAGQSVTLPTHKLPAGTYTVHWERPSGSSSKIWVRE